MDWNGHKNEQNGVLDLNGRTIPKFAEGVTTRKKTVVRAFRQDQHICHTLVSEKKTQRSQVWC